VKNDVMMIDAFGRWSVPFPVFAGRPEKRSCWAICLRCWSHGRMWPNWRPIKAACFGAGQIPSPLLMFFFYNVTPDLRLCKLRQCPSSRSFQSSTDFRGRLTDAGHRRAQPAEVHTTSRRVSELSSSATWRLFGQPAGADYNSTEPVLARGGSCSAI